MSELVKADAELTEQEQRAFVRSVLRWAEVHVSNLDPRCATFGDWTHKGWNNADIPTKPCENEGCIGCGHLLLTEHLRRALAMMESTP